MLKWCNCVGNTVRKQRKEVDVTWLLPCVCCESTLTQFILMDPNRVVSVSAFAATRSCCSVLAAGSRGFFSGFVADLGTLNLHLERSRCNWMCRGWGSCSNLITCSARRRVCVYVQGFLRWQNDKNPASSLHNTDNTDSHLEMERPQECRQNKNNSKKENIVNLV